MVFIKKNYIKSDKISYFYQPEGKGEFGELEYDLAEETLEVIKKAEHDLEEVDMYRQHAFKMILDFVDNENYLDEQTAYWY